MKIRTCFRAVVLILSGVLGALFPTASSLGRDPRSEELPEIFEIASRLTAEIQQAYLDFSQWAGTREVDRALPYLRELNDKAAEFYEKIPASDKTPWRTVGAYKEMNKAYAQVQEVFTQRSLFGISPYALREIVFFMGVLQQYYLYPAVEPDAVFYSVPAYPPPPPVYYPNFPRGAYSGRIILRR